MAQVNGWMTMADPFANMVFAKGGWDSVTLEAQHGLFDEASIVRSLLALSAPIPRRLVRVPSNDPAIIGKVLDAGADGIIAPMVNSAEEARRLADACWHPPKGTRSFGPILAALRATPPFLQTVHAVEILAMIETREALGAVEAIAAIDGITGLYVGPNDLALSLGFPAGSDRDEPELIGHFQTIIQAASRFAKTAGIFCASARYARRMVDLGFSMVTVVTDAAVLGQGAETACADVRSV